MRRFALLAVAISCVAQADYSFYDTVSSNRTDQILSMLQPRELGPTTMGGRITNLAVVEKEPRIFYVATASSGLWKTTNGGMTLTPVFHKETTVALGAVDIDQDNPDLVWVGTGEQNSRNSTSYGNGVYKSEDGGATWKHMGLAETLHISRIIVHPEDSDTVFVAALGHLWGENEERGIYKTTDGGETWKKVLYENERSGFIAMEMHPEDPDTIIAASWERMRWPYRWASGGPSSTIYKTTDGGDNWKPIMEGLPESDTGRVGLSYFRSDPDVIIASVEKPVRGEGEEREVLGGVYKSSNGGESWSKLNDINPRPFYFSVPVQDPVDPDRIYLVATQFHYSEDAGKNFKTMRMSIHVDHHALWVNPNDNNHMILGNDGGIAQTRDRGESWEHLNYLRAAQFYAIGVDMRKPYWVYGGLQDNGSWGGPTQALQGAVVHTDWFRVGGGDGFYVQVDPNDWRVVYSESQGGAVSRTNIETGERVFIRPRRGPDGERVRFNWNTPIHISPHNSQIIYVGSQFLHRSINRGDDWEAISPDLSTNDPEKQNPRAGVTPEDTGAERHTTITTISESPLLAGVIWVGTDDGNVQVTQDGGDTWTNVIENIEGVPANTWVSRVRASNFEEGRAYVTFDGHRNDDYKPYVFVTEDYGATWENITAGMPEFGSTKVIVEGTENPDLLAVGTEFGLFTSLDRGITWTPYKTADWPTVRVDDLVIHPREKDLVVGTHGRGIWIVPFAPMEQLTNDALEAEAFLCKPKTMYLLGFTAGRSWNGDRMWGSFNTEQRGEIYYHLKEATDEDVTIVISRPGGEEIGEIDGTGLAGLNHVTWVPRRRQQISEGTYVVTLKYADKEYSTTIEVEATFGK